VLAVLFVAIPAVLLRRHEPHAQNSLLFAGASLVVVGTIIGFGIGVVALHMGVAGGELLIPTIVLLFGADIKLAGRLGTVIRLYPRPWLLSSQFPDIEEQSDWSDSLPS
jgi:uncharacterized membrane protein YfcA